MAPTSKKNSNSETGKKNDTKDWINILNPIIVALITLAGVLFTADRCKPKNYVQNDETTIVSGQSTPASIQNKQVNAEPPKRNDDESDGVPFCGEIRNQFKNLILGRNVEISCSGVKGIVYAVDGKYCINIPKGMECFNLVAKLDGYDSNTYKCLKYEDNGGPNAVLTLNRRGEE